MLPEEERADNRIRTIPINILLFKFTPFIKNIYTTPATDNRIDSFCNILGRSFKNIIENIIVKIGIVAWIIPASEEAI
ncbi:hypothetical protein CFSAN002367_00375 [Clostridium botulinum CFSAN002367]|nr:hypothetical protein CFSAN002367_00375 [Clostridium botulinum CFSAN002367]